MPWYCPNEKCPNVRELNPHESCPICGKKAQKFGGFFGRLSKSLLERKSIIKEWKPPPKCSKCGNEMVQVPSSIVKLYPRGLHGVPTYLCIKCMNVLFNIPKDLLEVWIGKVVRGIDRATGIMRLRIEHPKNKLGMSTIHIPYYLYFEPWEREKIYLKRGDNVAVGGYYESNGRFIGVYYKNLTANVEGSLMGSDGNIRFRRNLIPGQRGKEFLTFESPLVLKSQKMIEEAVHNYRIPKKIRTGKVSRYHEQASSFELLISQLLERMGFKDVYISGGASDKGVDIEAYIEDPFGHRERVIVQCKHQAPSNKIKPTQVRDFAHAIEREKAHGVRKGYFITSSYFSPECFEEENCGKNMELIDRDRLEKLLKDKELTLPVN